MKNGAKLNLLNGREKSCKIETIKNGARLIRQPDTWSTNLCDGQEAKQTGPVP